MSQMQHARINKLFQSAKSGRPDEVEWWRSGQILDLQSKLISECELGRSKSRWKIVKSGRGFIF